MNEKLTSMAEDSLDNAAQALLDSVEVVLVETSHPGNIGSVARALKNMGMCRIVLVNPKEYPHVKATARASGAFDLLQQVKVVGTLDEAISDSCLVLGASARDRRLSWPRVNVDQAPTLIQQKHQAAPGQTISVLFGRESSGLTNDELTRCHYHMQIPANPDYSSLNLAAAVQVFSYEMRKHALQLRSTAPAQQHDSPVASVEAVAQMYEHLERVLHELNFINAEQPEKLRQRIKRMFNRIELEHKEVQILRGICSAIENAIRQKQ